MSLSARYLTNGKKAVYVAIDRSGPHPVYYVGEHKEDIPESIRDYLPHGEPLFVGPNMAALLHAQDILYPNFPKCGHPNYIGLRCVAESCKFAANGNWNTCPFFPGYKTKGENCEN